MPRPGRTRGRAVSVFRLTSKQVGSREWKSFPRTMTPRRSSLAFSINGSPAATMPAARAWVIARSPFRRRTSPACCTWATPWTTPFKTPLFASTACAAYRPVGSSVPIMRASRRKRRSTKSSPRRAFPAANSVARSSSTPAGIGRMNTADTSLSKSSAWAARSISTTRTSPWIPNMPPPCARCSAIGTMTALSTAASAS